MLKQFIQGWFRLSRDIRLIIFSLFIWWLGFSIYTSFLSIYLRQLGARPEQIGLVFSISYLVAMLVNIPGGILADRFDRKRTQIISQSLGALSVLIYPFTQRWEIAMFGVLLYFFSTISAPTTNAYIADACDKKELSTAFAITYATIPAGQLLGPGIGGFLADRLGIHAIFFVGFAFSALAVAVLGFISPQSPPQRGVKIDSFLEPLRDRHFVVISGLAIVLYLYFSMTIPFLGPYLAEEHRLNLAAIGTLASVGSIGSILLTSLLGRIGDSRNRVGVLAISVIAFAVAMLLIGYFSFFPILVIAFVLRGSFTSGQSMMHAIIANVAQGKASGTYFGTFGLATGIGLTIAPSVGGWLYSESSPIFAFQVLSVVGVLLALLIIGPVRLYVRQIIDTPPPAPMPDHLSKVETPPVGSAEQAQ